MSISLIRTISISDYLSRRLPKSRALVNMRDSVLRLCSKFDLGGRLLHFDYEVRHPV